MKKLIDIIKFIVIGIIQGLTEIFPISSSGHLAIAYDLLKIDSTNQLDITIYLHLASSIALCLFFKNQILQMIKGFFNFVFLKKKEYKEDFNLAIYLVLASIPICIVGFFLKPLVENFFTNLIFVACGFILTSFILFISSKLKENKESKYTFKNTFITGCIQCFSIFPGISRSGITLFGSKVTKLESKKGKEFTFLLLIPISLGSTILSIFDCNFASQFAKNTIYLYFIAMCTAFVATHIALKLFLKEKNTINYKYYALYLLFLGIFSLIYYL